MRSYDSALVHECVKVIKNCTTQEVKRVRSSLLYHCLNTYEYMYVNFFCIFFGGLECVGHSFAYVAHFVFLRDAWIRTQSAAVASKRATNSNPSPLLSHPSPLFSHPSPLLSHPSPYLATYLPYLATQLPYLALKFVF
jgi:hypothetical protein